MIGAGHRHEDIPNYPLSVYKGYLRASQKAISREAKRMFNIVATATGGSPEERKALWKDLGNG